MVMKSILLFTFFGFFLKAPTGVFNGVLKYESDYDMAGEVGKVRIFHPPHLPRLQISPSCSLICLPYRKKIECVTE